MTAIEAAIKFLAHDHNYTITATEGAGLIRLPVGDDLLDRLQVSKALEALTLPISVNRDILRPIGETPNTPIDQVPESMEPSYAGFTKIDR